jgi:DNA-binding CsgD family transcriptional regulator
LFFFGSARFALLILRTSVTTQLSRASKARIRGVTVCQTRHDLGDWQGFFIGFGGRMQQLGQNGFSQVRTKLLGAQRSGLDLRAWSEALYDLPTGAVTEADFRAWLEGPLRRFFPFQRFLGAYGSLSGHRVQMQTLITSGHGQEFVASRRSTFDLKWRGCFRWLVSTRRAVLLDRTRAIDATGMRVSPTECELDDLERFSLGALAAHGIIDPFARTGTYLGFSGVPTAQRAQLLASLELISPVVHTLYLQTKPFSISAEGVTSLTDRQRDLADLAALGLSDKEIGSRLGISDHTVGNHFRAIYARLGISKRSQLIAFVKSHQVGEILIR